MKTRSMIETLRMRVSNERGSMLLVALMVLMALTSVAMLSIHMTNSEIGFAGNNRRGAATFRVTESGAFTALTHALDLGPEGFVADVAAKVHGLGQEVAGAARTLEGVTRTHGSAL